MYRDPNQYFEAQLRRAFVFIGIPLIPVVAYTIYVGFTGTGYETNALQHFAIARRGVAIDLGPCHPRFPPSRESLAVTEGTGREAVSTRGVVTAFFRPGDTEFYLFVRRSGDAEWEVLHDPKLDYRDVETRVWVADLRGPLGPVSLVGACGDEQSAKLSDGMTVRSLPDDLHYAQPRLIEISSGPEGFWAEFLRRNREAWGRVSTWFKGAP